MGPLPAQHMGPQNLGQPPVGFLALHLMGWQPFTALPHFSWLLGPAYTPAPPLTHTHAERMQVGGGFADQMCACSGLHWTLFHLISCGTCFGYTIVESGESPLGISGLIIALCALGPTL